MQKAEITQEFLTAGNARFLVSNPNGLQYTFRVKSWKNRYDRVFYFVSAQERSQWMNFIQMGTLDPETWTFIHGKERAAIAEDHVANEIFQWAVLRIVKQDGLPKGYSIKHCGYCGVCGRPLSVEESVIRGIGPVCYGKAVEHANRARIHEGSLQQTIRF